MSTSFTLRAGHYGSFALITGKLTGYLVYWFASILINNSTQLTLCHSLSRYLAMLVIVHALLIKNELTSLMRWVVSLSECYLCHDIELISSWTGDNLAKFWKKPNWAAQLKQLDSFSSGCSSSNPAPVGNASQKLYSLPTPLQRSVFSEHCHRPVKP